MRLVFAGTPAAALPTLRCLAAVHDIAVVITRPDAPLGRRRVLTPSPVAATAGELGLPVIGTARLDEEVTGQIAALRPDLGVIVAYGGLVREPLLDIPTHGWINLHFSLLPAWRGAAPVQRALIAGDVELGASVFQLVPELDAGDVFARQAFSVPSEATADEALTLLAEAGAALTADVVGGIADGTARATPQTGTPTFAPKLDQTDGLLDWGQNADAVFARFRGVTSEPGAHTTVGGQRVKILGLARADSPEADEPIGPGVLRSVRGGVLVGTGTTPLLLTRVQPAGKGPMDAADWFRGLRPLDGVLPRAGR